MHMNKVILLPLFVLLFISSFSLKAQTSYEIQCTMTLEEISQVQPFNVDHYKQENVRDIVNTLFTELDLIYDKLNNDQGEPIAQHIEAVHTAIESAEEIEMNYSMFDADLEIIETVE